MAACLSGGRVLAQRHPVARARRLIEARQYVLDPDWGEVQSRADKENAFLAAHPCREYDEWHSIIFGRRRLAGVRLFSSRRFHCRRGSTAELLAPWRHGE
jgi:hypothetical protein